MMANLSRTTPSRHQPKWLVRNSHVAVREVGNGRIEMTVTAANDETGADIYYHLSLAHDDILRVRRLLGEMEPSAS